jgi:amino acid adenylation domain-containing protein
VDLLLHYETEKLCLPLLPSCHGKQTAPTLRKSGAPPAVQFGNWLLEQLRPGAAQNLICRAFTVRGQLTEYRFQEAFRELVRCNDALRSSFNQMGEAKHELLPVDHFRLEFVDLRRVSPPDQDESIQTTCEEEHLRRFDLEHGPLIRGKLLLRSDTDGVFLLVLHRLVADEWSLAPMFSEIIETYNSGAAASRKVAEKQSLSGEGASVRTDDRAPSNSERGFEWANWPRLELPRDGQSSLSSEGEGALYEFRLDNGCISLLQTASRIVEEHPAVLLLAAFQTLLGQLSSSEDIMVGIQHHNRSPENADAIGTYACLVPMRLSLADCPTFRTAVGYVKDSCRQAETFSDSALEALFECYARQRGSSQQVFQAGFAYTEKVPELFQSSDLIWDFLQLRKFWVQHELELRVLRKPEECLCVLAYDRSLYTPKTIRWIGELLQRVLRHACNDPDREIVSYELLTAVEREQILVTRNLSRSTDGSKRSIFQEIERHAQETPDAVAVSCGADHLSYGMLNARSSHLARALKDAGVLEGSCVALCAPRDSAMLVGMLGIMKAGAVYLPLDPAYPDTQIAFMLANSRPVLLLASASDARRFENTGVSTLILEAIIATAAANQTNHTNRPTPRHLAYVMYTSGSTGTPKGVMVAHSGMWNHVWAKACDLKLSSSDIVAQTASCSFDISIWQFLSPLVAGARVEILAAEDAADAVLLVEQLDRLSITVWETVPVLLGLIINDQRLLSRLDRYLPALRTVISNAEALTTDMARQWQQLYPHIQLLNTYGATEASDDTSHYWIGQDFAANTVHVPLGTPIGESKIYLLDRNLAPVPSCIPGEIYLGGPGVVPGYVNAPALTAERFLPDCFSSRPGDRMYRTGDRGRWLHNGDLEFLGRRDHQIKIRGHRVEPDQVASVIRAHSMVEQAAVIATHDGGDTNLAAFVAWREKANRNPGELRGFLKARLPEYMMPASIVEVPALPVTPNGKLDRRALHSLLRAERHVAPGTATEGILAEIFEEILGVERISIQVDFFACGGTIYKALQLLARVRQILEVELPLRVVFESSTIAGLAQAVATIDHPPTELALSEDARFVLLHQVS